MQHSEMGFAAPLKVALGLFVASWHLALTRFGTMSLTHTLTFHDTTTPFDLAIPAFVFQSDLFRGSGGTNVFHGVYLLCLSDGGTNSKLSGLCRTWVFGNQKGVGYSSVQATSMQVWGEPVRQGVWCLLVGVSIGDGLCATEGEVDHVNHPQALCSKRVCGVKIRFCCLVGREYKNHVAGLLWYNGHKTASGRSCATRIGLSTREYRQKRCFHNCFSWGL